MTDRIYIVPRHQKLLELYLYLKFACRSKIINVLLPLRYPINCAILVCGGILTSICSRGMLLLLLFEHLFARVISQYLPNIFFQFSIYFFASKLWCKGDMAYCTFAGDVVTVGEYLYYSRIHIKHDSDSVPFPHCLTAGTPRMSR